MSRECLNWGESAKIEAHPRRSRAHHRLRSECLLALRDGQGASASCYDSAMPTISTFFGLVIQMFWREHAPPHFHALYAEYEVEIDIRTLEVLQGKLPRRALALVLEWAAEHRNELMEDWTLCQAKQLPKKIPPLD
jgi:hypothetical protein